MKLQATIGENEHNIELSPESGTFKSGDKEGNYSFEFVNGRHILRTGTKTYKIDNVSYEGSGILLKTKMNKNSCSTDSALKPELLQLKVF